MMPGKKSTAPAAQTHEPQPPPGTLDAHLKLCLANAALGINISPCRIIFHHEDNALPIDLVKNPLQRLSIATKTA